VIESTSIDCLVGGSEALASVTDITDKAYHHVIAGTQVHLWLCGGVTKSH